MTRPFFVLVDPALTFSIHPRRWKALLAAFGVELPLDPLLAPPEALARALWGVRSDARFAEVVDVLGLLTSDVGHAALLTAALEEKRELPTGLGPGNLAAYVLTRRARDESWEPVIEEALLQFARLVPDRPAFERMGALARPISDPSGCLESVKQAAGKRAVDAFLATDDDGVVHVAVLRRDAPRTSGRVTRGGIALVTHSAVVTDLLHVDVPAARFTARTRHPGRASAYARALGRALYGDDGFFSDAPIFAHGALAQLGSARVAQLRAPDVPRMRVVDLWWDDDRGTTHHTHGSDALAAFEERGGARGGHILSSMLRLDSPLSVRPIDALIHYPNRLAVREARLERLARGALHALGIDAPGAMADDAFTLAPFVLAEWRWRRVLGDPLFESLRDRKILVAVARARVVTGRAEEKLGGTYVAFDLRSRPGKRYAVALDPSLPSRLVGDDEDKVWKLDPAALARAYEAELGTERSRPREAIASHVLDLGELRTATVALSFWLVLSAPANAAEARSWLAAIVRGSKGAHAVLLLPEGRSLGGSVEVGLTTGEIFGAEGTAGKVLSQASEKLGVEGAIEPWRLVPKGVRFVGEAKTLRCWFDGVELVRLSDAGAKMLQAVGSENGAIVPTPKIESIISPKRTSHGAASETAAKIGEWVRRSFEDAGKPLPPDFAELIEVVGNKGWRMKVRSEVR